MKKSTIFQIVCTTLLMAFLHTPLSRAEVCNRVVAIVNDDVITLHELNNRIRELTGAEPDILKAQDEEQYLTTRQQIIDFLIDEKIAHEKVKELGLNVSEKEVDAYIENLKKENQVTQEEMLESLKERGVNLEMYRKKVKAQLERIQLVNYEVNAKIIIREEKIQDYYNQHKDKFIKEESVNLASIILMQESPESHDSQPLQEKAKEIILRLENGEDFGELAKEFSHGPGAEEGGNLGLFKTAELDPELAGIIGGMSPGDVSAPIARPNAIQLIKLVEREVGGLRSLDETRNYIYSILYKEEVDKRYSSWIKALREKAYTKVIF